MTRSMPLARQLFPLGAKKVIRERIPAGFLHKLSGCESFCRGGQVPLFWHDTRNWGDGLSPKIIEMVSGKRAYKPTLPVGPRVFAIGSILDAADRYSIIWGSGFISEVSVPKECPHHVRAVRGPLTRDVLLKLGCACPETYGDPAILLPLYYSPTRHTRFKIGVIPHYVDQGAPVLKRIQGDPSIRIIDVNSETFDFVDQVCSCEVILSSSLHGLICADSYGIPSSRVVFSDKIAGGDFKFTDYRLGLGGDPHRVPGVTNEVGALYKAVELASLSNVESAQCALLGSAPF